MIPALASVRAGLWPRLPFFGLALIITVAGLWLRYGGMALPHVVRKEGADALYATLMYLLARSLAPGLARRVQCVTGAVLFCFAIEISQLYHAAWLDAVRATTAGGLVLGHGFHAADLVAYVVGVGLGLAIELAAWRLGAGSGAGSGSGSAATKGKTPAADSEVARRGGLAEDDETR